MNVAISQSLDTLYKVPSSSLCGNWQIKRASGNWLCITLTCAVLVWTDAARVHYGHRHWLNLWCACSTFKTHTIHCSWEEHQPFEYMAARHPTMQPVGFFFPYLHAILHMISAIYVCPLGILTGCRSAFLILSLRRIQELPPCIPAPVGSSHRFFEMDVGLGPGPICLLSFATFAVLQSQLIPLGSSNMLSSACH